MTTRRFLPWTLCLLLAAVAVWLVSDADRAAAGLPTGAAPASIGALEFGDDGTLFAGDSQGAAVYAFQVDEPAAARPEEVSVSDLDAKVAALLGAGPRDIFIKDLAVHPESGTAYLSVMRGHGAESRPALVRVRGDGAVENLKLDALPHALLALEDAPFPDPEARRDPRALAITDLELIDGELFIAGLSNEEFASVLRRAPYPFAAGARATGLEIYHGAHGRFETHAPVYTFMPFTIDGKTHLLASYLCTPLVTFSLDALRREDRLRGKTIAELGFGNVPIDMLSYRWEGEEYVLMTNTRRGTMRMRAADIRAAQGSAGITTEVVDVVAGVPYLTSPLGHVLQIDDFDATSILMLIRDPENGALTLGTRGKRWL